MESLQAPAFGAVKLPNPQFAVRLGDHLQFDGDPFTCSGKADQSSQPAIAVPYANGAGSAGGGRRMESPQRARQGAEIIAQKLRVQQSRASGTR